MLFDKLVLQAKLNDSLRISILHSGYLFNLSLKHLVFVSGFNWKTKASVSAVTKSLLKTNYFSQKFVYGND